MLRGVQAVVRVAPAALLVALLVAAPADAAVVTREDARAVFHGGDEANDVTVRGSNEVVRVRDEAAPLDIASSAEGFCVRVDEHEVECRQTAPVAVHTGGGDDRLHVTGAPLRAYAELGEGNDTAEAESGYIVGGPGDDELRGALVRGGAGDDLVTVVDELGHSGAGEEGDDVVVGSGASDELSGGPGRDRIEAGAGDDELLDEDGASPAPDVYDGGPGTDRMLYGDQEFRSSPTPRTAAVTVDLAAGTAGAPGEHDALAGLEGAVGTDYDDLLSGTDGADRLDGGDGNDVVDGRGGADLLEDGPGSDRVSGGDGDDELRSRAGDDVLDGGPGADVLHGLFGRDTLLGGDGPDRLSGGEGPDVLDAGAGSDVVHAEGDFVRDAVRCGDDADVTVADRGDVVDPACESARLVPVPFPRFLTAPGQRGPAVSLVLRRSALLEVGCLASLMGRDPRLVLYVGGREVGRAGWECGWNDLDPFRGRYTTHVYVTLTAAAARRLRRERRLRAVAVIDLGLEAQLLLKERLVLRSSIR